MGVPRPRRFRRQETVQNDEDYEPNEDGEDAEEDDNGNDDEDEDDTTTTRANGLLPANIENKIDNVKEIGQDIIKKVPSKLH